jgi:DNA-binding NtrC family response regulator
MPSLRDRRDDIPLLVRDTLEQAPGGKRASARLIEALTAADWPGNVEQLVATVQQLAERVEASEIGIRDLTSAEERLLARSHLSRLEAAELQQIREALEEAGGNRVKAAAALEIGRSTLYRRIDSFTSRGFEFTD